jgi:hypothetical protein
VPELLPQLQSCCYLAQGRSGSWLSLQLLWRAFGAIERRHQLALLLALLLSLLAPCLALAGLAGVLLLLLLLLRLLLQLCLVTAKNLSLHLPDAALYPLHHLASCCRVAVQALPVLC